MATDSVTNIPFFSVYDNMEGRRKRFATICRSFHTIGKNVLEV